VKKRRVTLDWDGLAFDTETARRVGHTLSYHWDQMQTGTGTKLCVKFHGIGRIACEKTKYIGNRASSLGPLQTTPFVKHVHTLS
jgi:hypothetical protein